MPGGFFGTRANLLIDSVFVINLIAPFWALYAARIARTDGRRHMQLQLVLWAILFVCLLALEGYIRISGGSGSLIAGSPHAGTPLLRGVFVVHIFPALATYVLWAATVFMSYRRRHTALPGSFSRRHKKLGLIVIAGLFWTAASAMAVYWFGFVAA